jgi:hypothetical protein
MLPFLSIRAETGWKQSATRRQANSEAERASYGPRAMSDLPLKADIAERSIHLQRHAIGRDCSVIARLLDEFDFGKGVTDFVASISMPQQCRDLDIGELARVRSPALFFRPRWLHSDSISAKGREDSRSSDLSSSFDPSPRLSRRNPPWH